MSTIDIIDGPATAQPLPWPEFRAELLSLYELPIRTLAARRELARTLDLVGALGVATTADLTAPLVAQFVAGRPAGESPHTTLKHLRNIRIAANVALRSGYLARSPFLVRPVNRWIRVPRPAGKRHLTRPELAALLGTLRAECDDGRAGWPLWKARRLHAMAATAAMAGLRAGELCRLEVGDLAMADRIIHVRPHQRQLKTAASAAPVPMCDALAAILQAWLAFRLAPPTMAGRPPSEIPWIYPGCRGRGPWTNGPPGEKPVEILGAAGRRAGIEGVTFQALRRSLATHLEGDGVGGAMIARILRHSERVSEEYYRQADAENMRRAVAGLSF